jgi:hypothetical protein
MNINASGPLSHNLKEKNNGEVNGGRPTQVRYQTGDPKTN